MLIRRAIPSKFAIFDRLRKVFIFHCEEIEHLGWFAHGAIETGYEIKTHFHMVAKYNVNENYCIIIDHMLNDISIVDED